MSFVSLVLTLNFDLNSNFLKEHIVKNKIKKVWIAVQIHGRNQTYEQFNLEIFYAVIPFRLPLVIVIINSLFKIENLLFLFHESNHSKQPLVN